MRRKWTRKILIATFSVFILCMGVPVQNFMDLPIVTNSLAKTILEEGTNIRLLEPNKTYKKYDFTGDGEKDSFKYKIKESEMGERKAYIYLSGERIGKVSLLRGGDVYSCQVDEDTNLLVFTCWQYGANLAQVYICDGKKLKKLDVNFEDYSLDYIKPYAVEDGKVLMLTMTGKHDRIIGAGEQACFLMEYEYEDGEISLTSHYAKVIGEAEYKARDSFSTSSSPKKDNEKGVYVKKDDKVEVIQYYFDDDHHKVQVKANGEKGWLTIGSGLVLVDPEYDEETDR